MPGTPPETPVFSIPRYSDADTASFSSQVNAISDTVDAKAVLNTDSRLSDERVPEDGSVTTAKLATGAVTPAKFSDDTLLHQPGDLIWSASSARAGCLLCDGSAVSRTTYSALFVALGTNYGNGDGSTTFNVPDFRGRVPVGAGSGPGLSVRSRGQKGGEESHTLIDAEMPAHDHTGLTGSQNATHTHGVGGNTNDVTADSSGHHVPAAPSGDGWTTGNQGSGFPGAAFSTGASVQDSSLSHHHSFILTSVAETTFHQHAIASDGGGAAHDNMPPYGVVNCFVKT